MYTLFATVDLKTKNKNQFNQNQKVIGKSYYGVRTALGPFGSRPYVRNNYYLLAG